MIASDEKVDFAWWKEYGQNPHSVEVATFLHLFKVNKPWILILEVLFQQLSGLADPVLPIFTVEVFTSFCDVFSNKLVNTIQLALINLIKVRENMDLFRKLCLFYEKA